MSRRDWPTDIGLTVVGLAAAILTFNTLRDLAEACGITGTFIVVPLAFLVPVTVDAAGVVAARVWLKRTAGEDAVRFGRILAWCCIGSSIVGNAGQHGMEAYGISPPWWVVVMVSAVPPAMLGAVVHLAHLVVRTNGVTPLPAASDATPLETPGDEVASELEVPGEPGDDDHQDAPGAGGDLDSVRDLVANGAGRGTLMKELGVSEYQARQLIASVTTNGVAAR